MSKFTPAPWRVTEQILDETDTNLITDTYNGVSAGAGYLDNDEGGTGVGFSFTGCMNRADADLIAAAPEMYEALHEAHGALKATRNSLIQIGASIAPYFDEILAHCEAALAKANGVQP